MLIGSNPIVASYDRDAPAGVVVGRAKVDHAAVGFGQKLRAEAFADPARFR